MQQANTQRKASSEILGVEFKVLQTHPDQRGFFREVVRSSDAFFGEGFAQWSHSCMQRNTVKAWHFHHRQVDWWYCGIGVLEVALYDARPESDTRGNLLHFYLGQSEELPEAAAAVVKIPQGVLHGCKVLTESAHLFYITSEHYNPADEGRIPFNSEEVPFSWGQELELIVAEKDTKLFIPPHPRLAESSASR